MRRVFSTLVLLLALASPAALQERLQLPNKDGSVKFLVIGDSGTGGSEQRAVANRIADKSPIALQLAKEAVKIASRSNLDEGLRREVDLFALCFSTEDKDEGVSAFLEKRKAAFKGK